MNPAPAARHRSSPSLESLASINDDGSHVRIHPADVRGRFTLARRIVALLLIALYVALPWIPVGGAPAVFLDVAHLRFHFFGLTLAAQDLWLGFFLLSGFGFTLFYVTALLGRLWCGWACPQTVFLEHVFRRIERLIEGDAPARRRLDAAPWATPKVLRRGLEHALFLVVSLVITHVFLAYFVPVPELLVMVTYSPLDHWGLFLAIIAATALIYGNFAWFREQLCIIICPYGRLQSALIDDNTISIGYDARRGEPRGKRRQVLTLDNRRLSSGPAALDFAAVVKSQDLTSSPAGDCIDCFRCVQVCPTGIDIRQGLQLECIGCASCIDACDAIMTRLGRPRGVVRYDSLNGLNGLKTRLLRPRILLYSALLAVGAAVAVVAASRYEPASLSTVRMQGAPYYVDANSVRNQFMVRVINKQSVDAEFSLRVDADDAPDGLRWTGWEMPVLVAPGGEEVVPLVVFVPRDHYEGRFPLRLHLAGEPGGVALTRTVEFAGPDPRLLREHEEHRDDRRGEGSNRDH